MNSSEHAAGNPARTGVLTGGLASRAGCLPERAVSRPAAPAVQQGELDMPAIESDVSWREDALCAQTDPEAFFPEKGASSSDAKRVCAGCDVREQCLAFALRHDERFGIWGGLSTRERDRLKAARIAEQGAGARAQREKRDAAIVDLARTEIHPGSIAVQFHITERTVQRVLARHRSQKPSRIPVAL